MKTQARPGALDGPPPPEALRAFGLDDHEAPAPLAGGQQVAWRIGSVVLKRLHTDLATLNWIEQVTTALDGRTDFRVAPPLRTADGDLVSLGWTAWRYEPGDPVSRSWQASVSWRDVIRVGDDLNRAFAAFSRPAFLDDRQDQWALADRLAWGSGGEPFGIALSRSRSRLESVFTVMEQLRPIEAPSQLIHGDLAGNVLFVNARPPCVIDISPYWRPAPAAIATVVVDAMTFHRPGRSLIESQMHRKDFGQYLLRSLVFRMASDISSHARPAFDSVRDDPYLATFEEVLRAIERSSP